MCEKEEETNEIGKELKSLNSHCVKRNKTKMLNIIGKKEIKMTKEKLLTKAMKYEIKFDKDVYDILSDIQYAVFRIKNKATTLTYDWQQFSFSYKDRFDSYPNEKELLGKRLDNDIYEQTKEFGENIASATFNTAIVEAVNHFKKNKLEVLKGSRSISTYKREGAFPIRASQIKGIEKVNSKNYTVKLSLLSNKKAKELNTKTQQQVTILTGVIGKVILDRILSGDYKLCDSKIGKKKNKFFLILTYQFPQEAKLLDENRIMGIDLGVKVPATLAISDDDTYREFVGDGKEIRDFEDQVIARKKRIQRSRKWAGQGSVGHGTKCRLKAVDKIGNKISNFKDTKNHCWSKYIVDEAIKHKCGTIQMEDLTGISEVSKFLKTWTYYDLQTKIEYKAEQFGIKVVKVKPSYTSQRCNNCGCINKENRDAKVSQEKFECVVCGYKINADVNAARNIAMKDIENIIKEQVELQKKQTAPAMKFELV